MEQLDANGNPEVMAAGNPEAMDVPVDTPVHEATPALGGIRKAREIRLQVDDTSMGADGYPVYT